MIKMPLGPGLEIRRRNKVLLVVGGSGFGAIKIGSCGYILYSQGKFELRHKKPPEGVSVELVNSDNSFEVVFKGDRTRCDDTDTLQIEHTVQGIRVIPNFR